MAFLRQSDFTPLFRLLDDYETHRSRPTRSVFTPSFDVRESSDGYYLDGELPGVNQNNIDIEFSDPQTLLIKGHTERNYNSTPENQPETQEIPSSPKHQATVEDDDEDDDSRSSASTTQRHSDSETQVQAKQTRATSSQEKENEKKFHFWVSERSIGEFERTFTFASRVDQDGVRASLKNGILSVYVPKEAQPKMKKIRILWSCSLRIRLSMSISMDNPLSYCYYCMRLGASRDNVCMNMYYFITLFLA